MQTSKVKSNNFLCAPRTSFNYTVEEARWSRRVTDGAMLDFERRPHTMRSMQMKTRSP